MPLLLSLLVANFGSSSSLRNVTEFHDEHNIPSLCFTRLDKRLTRVIPELPAGRPRSDSIVMITIKR